MKLSQRKMLGVVIAVFILGFWSWAAAGVLTAADLATDCADGSAMIPNNDGPTDVEGDATFGGCTITVAGIVLKFKGVTLNTGGITITGAAKVEIKENSTWTAGGDFSIENTAGDINVLDTNLTAGQISILAGDDILIKRTTLAATNGDLSTEAADDVTLDNAGMTVTAGNNLDAEAGGRMTVKNNCLLSSGNTLELLSDGYSVVKRNNTLMADTNVVIDAGIGPLLVNRIAFDVGNDVNINADTVTVKANDFTNVDGSVSITGATNCTSKDNTPSNPPCN